jgi:precorrin-6A/cobalt-precorrin-6A reductase
LILLLGGTSETMGIATALAEAGWRTLVSTATDNELDTGDHPLIQRRGGRLTKSAMADLVREIGAKAIVDATHPYAVEAKITAFAVCADTGIAYISFMRPGIRYDYERIHFVENHEEAAVMAFSMGRPVLLTTGSRNLLPYARQRSKTGLRIVARVLPHEESFQACKAAGLSDDEVITGRGPFSLDENVDVIRRYGIGVIVTKESGAAGGAPEKVEAARRESIHVVMVDRPAPPASDSLASVDELVRAVRRVMDAGI